LIKKIYITAIISFFLILFVYPGNTSANKDDKRKAENKKSKAKKEEDITRLVVLPFAYYTKETKIAVGGSAYYYSNPGSDSNTRPSYIGIDFTFTEMSQMVFNFITNLYLDQNEYHLLGILSFSEYPSYFYGIGGGTQETELEMYTPLNFLFQINAQKQISEGFYIGLSYRFWSIIMDDYDPSREIGRGLITGSRGGLISSAGLIFTYDTRDSIYYPKEGNLFHLWINRSDELLGSDFEYTGYYINLRKYIEVFGNHVLALQYITSIQSGDPPFQAMPALGGSSLMRGYYYGRYRDTNLVAAQIEYRMPLIWKFGAVAFCSIGDATENITDINLKDLKYSAGGGLRFFWDEEKKIVIRLDAGFTQDSSAVIATVGTAF